MENMNDASPDGASNELRAPLQQTLYLRDPQERPRRVESLPNRLRNIQFHGIHNRHRLVSIDAGGARFYAGSIKLDNTFMKPHPSLIRSMHVMM